MNLLMLVGYGLELLFKYGIKPKVMAIAKERIAQHEIFKTLDAKVGDLSDAEIIKITQQIAVITGLDVNLLSVNDLANIINKIQNVSDRDEMKEIIIAEMSGKGIKLIDARVTKND